MAWKGWDDVGSILLQQTHWKKSEHVPVPVKNKPAASFWLPTELPLMMLLANNRVMVLTTDSGNWHHQDVQELRQSVLCVRSKSSSFDDDANTKGGEGCGERNRDGFSLRLRTSDTNRGAFNGWKAWASLNAAMARDVRRRRIFMLGQESSIHRCTLYVQSLLRRMSWSIRGILNKYEYNIPMYIYIYI